MATSRKTANANKGDGSEGPRPKPSLIVLADFGRESAQESATRAVWFWSAPDIEAWLAPRRALFPRASGDEMLTLAFMPDELREAMVDELCSVDKQKAKRSAAFGGVLEVLQKPALQMLSATCVVLTVRGTPLQTGAKAIREQKAALALFEAQVAKVAPEAMRADWAATDVGITEIEPALVAAWERRALGAATAAGEGVARPGLRL